MIEQLVSVCTDIQRLENEKWFSGQAASQMPRSYTAPLAESDDKQHTYGEMRMRKH